jgi:hypothetical protein
MKTQYANLPGMLYLEPTYGLANRMRAIASGLELAQKTKKKITLVWVNDGELNCSFQELFQPIDALPILIKPVLWQFTKNSKQDKPILKLTTKLVNKMMGFDYCVKEVDGETLREGGKWNIHSVINQHKSVYIQTCADFMENDSMLKQFKPVAELQAQIDARTKNFKSNTVGLHIRRTDHSESIKNSPLSLFIQRINEELCQDSDACFYLSTDDPETATSLRELYGEKILVFPKDFSRNSVQGIKDAVVDLFCLAKTRKIIGSFNSSFSNIASRISQIDLCIVTRKSSIFSKKITRYFLSRNIAPKPELLTQIRLTPHCIRVRY